MMVSSPVQPEDMVQGLSFLLNDTQTDMADYLEHKTMSALLKQRLTMLDPEQLSSPAWECFWHCFIAVGVWGNVWRVWSLLAMTQSS